MNKRMITACACMLGLAMGSIPAWAAERENKITEVKLEIEADYAEGIHLTVDDFEIAPKDEGYEIDSVLLDNEPAAELWCRHDSPILLISILADDDSYFNFNSKSKVKLYGAKGEVLSVKRDSEKDMIDVRVLLDPISSHIGNPYQLTWKSQSLAGWQEGFKCDKYEVRLLCFGKSVKTIRTTGTSCDFTQYMTKEGEYSFSVRGTNDNDGGYKSDWVTSTSRIISLETAEANAAANAAVKAAAKEAAKAAQAAEQAEQETGEWLLDQTGWWYRHPDQSYSVSKWEKINEVWYFFNEQGYLLTDTITPDGYQVDANGAWIEGEEK